jgi:hypothetical protein
MRLNLDHGADGVGLAHGGRVALGEELPVDLVERRKAKKSESKKTGCIICLLRRSASYPVPQAEFLHAPLDAAGGGALIGEADARGTEDGPHESGVSVAELFVVDCWYVLSID